MSWSVSHRSTRLALALFSVFLGLLPASAQTAKAAALETYEVNDSHFHLTNYIQEGTDIQKFLEINGDQSGPRRAIRHPFAATVVVSQFRRS